MGGEIGGMGSGRLISQIGERWEVGPKKQVGDGKLAPKQVGEGTLRPLPPLPYLENKK